MRGYILSHLHDGLAPLQALLYVLNFLSFSFLHGESKERCNMDKACGLGDKKFHLDLIEGHIVLERI